jgi:hypothetical protein
MFSFAFDNLEITFIIMKNLFPAFILVALMNVLLICFLSKEVEFEQNRFEKQLKN